MERGIQNAKRDRESYSRSNNAALFNSIDCNLDIPRCNRGVGKRALSWVGSGHKGLHTSGAQIMLTNIACCIVLTFCFAFSFFQGAYNHVVTEMVMERLLSMSLAELGEIEFHNGKGLI